MCLSALYTIFQAPFGICFVSWSLQTEGNEECLEMIQKRAVRMVSELKSDRSLKTN
jgi:hypothetical protein